MRNADADAAVSIKYILAPIQLIDRCHGANPDYRDAITVLNIFIRLLNLPSQRRFVTTTELVDVATRGFAQEDMRDCNRTR
jgi:hypothetical protein